jgi:hypothetical protein
MPAFDGHNIQGSQSLLQYLHPLLSMVYLLLLLKGQKTHAYGGE